MEGKVLIIKAVILPVLLLISCFYPTPESAFRSSSFHLLFPVGVQVGEAEVGRMSFRWFLALCILM